MEFNIRVLDQNWKNMVSSAGKLPPVVFCIEDLYNVLNRGYIYHNNGTLIRKLQMAIISGKRLISEGDDTEEDLQEYLEIFEEAWALFVDKVEEPVYAVDRLTKKRANKLNDYLQVLDMQCNGFVSRVPPVPAETMNKLRDLKFKFQSPLAAACNILMGSEVFNTKLAQLQIPELLTLSELARMDVEAFANSIT